MKYWSSISIGEVGVSRLSLPRGQDALSAFVYKGIILIGNNL